MYKVQAPYNSISVADLFSCCLWSAVAGLASDVRQGTMAMNNQ